MLKKDLSMTLALALMASFSLPCGAFALNYSGSQGNPATFETLEETRTSSPAAVASLETNNGKAFKSHPVLDSCMKGTTYVYRSPNLFEYLPEEVLCNTAPAGTVPLILAMHASGDDPRSFVDEIGLLALAGSERFAVLAPEHQ
jgi:hypothetical protein